jgi:NhaP-type Na+/H+ or K+/H+ antiporter
VTGIILELVIGVLAAWIFGRVRRRMKLPVTAKHYGFTILVVFVLLAIAYGASGHVSPH